MRMREKFRKRIGHSWWHMLLSELNHLAWMTCLSTSTRAGCWRPESRFHAQNIGSQSFWENFCANCKNENSTDLVFFFCLSSLPNGSQDRFPLPFFFRSVAQETVCMRCQMRLLLFVPTNTSCTEPSHGNRLLAGSILPEHSRFVYLGFDSKINK